MGFLLRLRNELHFHAGHSCDVLDKGEQLRLTKLFGYEGDEGVLPVERFMQDYFRHTTGMARVAERFAERNRPPRLVETLAEGVAEILLEEFGAPWCKVRVNKRGAVTGATDVGVVIERGSR